MKLLNCMCGAKAFDRADFISCLDECCDICGPSNDPTGGKWNALMAPHQPKAEAKRGTVRVRAYALISSNGSWAVNGWIGCSEGKVTSILYDMIEDFGENTMIHPVAFDIPLPAAVEIEGVVE